MQKKRVDKMNAQEDLKKLEKAYNDAQKEYELVQKAYEEIKEAPYKEAYQVIYKVYIEAQKEYYKTYSAYFDALKKQYKKYESLKEAINEAIDNGPPGYVRADELGGDLYTTWEGREDE